MAFLMAIALASFAAGAVAAVSGFGIGSLLTPLFAIQVGTKLAVAAISIPHFVATALRLCIMRKHVDCRLLLSFGLMSAGGGLAGALLHTRANSPAFTIVFGGLLIFSGAMGLSGGSKRLKFEGWLACVAGAISGVLGGMVGNQGGIRSAAMLGYEVPRHAFVATATAVVQLTTITKISAASEIHARSIVGIRPCRWKRE